MQYTGGLISAVEYITFVVTMTNQMDQQAANARIDNLLKPQD